MAEGEGRRRREWSMVMMMDERNKLMVRSETTSFELEGGMRTGKSEVGGPQLAVGAGSGRRLQGDRARTLRSETIGAPLILQ